MNITGNGVYTGRVEAEGYQSSSKNLLVECDPSDCGNCLAELVFPLEQRFCQETFLRVAVTNQDTGNQG